MPLPVNLTPIATPKDATIIATPAFVCDTVIWFRLRLIGQCGLSTSHH